MNNETMLKLRIWARAETTLAKMTVRRTGQRFTAVAIAVGLALLTVGMINLGTFELLAEAYGRAKGAYYLAAGNGLLAILLVLAAQRHKAGPEEEMVNEIREMALAELQTDADEIKDEFNRLTGHVRRIEDAVSTLTGSGSSLAKISTVAPVVELGKMSAQSLADDPEEYPILPESEYPDAYAHLRRIVGGVIDSPEIQYQDLFAYDQMKIINRDDVLNAFCTPGGYIYVYTGLIKYLDQEDHLAGVLGHEIAHAENRHSSIRLQKEFGVKALTGFVLLTLPISTSDYINASILKELMGLSYSRDQEAQAGRPIAVEGVSAKPARERARQRRHDGLAATWLGGNTPFTYSPMVSGGNRTRSASSKRDSESE